MPGKSKLKLLLVLAVVLAVSIVVGGVFSSPNKQQPSVTRVPPAYSKIRSIQIVGTRAVNLDAPGAAVEVEVRNLSHKPVMAIDLVAGDGAVTKNGLTDEKNPIVVIEPSGTTILTIGFSEISPGASLVVSAVTYGDGTEEGDEKSLRIMHKVRERDRAKMEALRREGRP